MLCIFLILPLSKEKPKIVKREAKNSSGVGGGVGMGVISTSHFYELEERSFYAANQGKLNYTSDPIKWY